MRVGHKFNQKSFFKLHKPLIASAVNSVCKAVFILHILTEIFHLLKDLNCSWFYNQKLIIYSPPCQLLQLTASYTLFTITYSLTERCNMQLKFPL